MFPPIPSDVEEEEAEDEFPLARKFSRHGANSGKHFSSSGCVVILLLFCRGRF